MAEQDDGDDYAHGVGSMMTVGVVPAAVMRGGGVSPAVTVLMMAWPWLSISRESAHDDDGEPTGDILFEPCTP